MWSGCGGEEVQLSRGEAIRQFGIEYNKQKSVIKPLLGQFKYSKTSADSVQISSRIKNALAELTNYSRVIMNADGVTDSEILKEFNSLDSEEVLLTGFFVWYSSQAETSSTSKVSADEDLYDCVLRSLGIEAAVELADRGLARMGARRAMAAASRIARRFLGPVGAAWAIYEFGDCMGWYKQGAKKSELSL